MYSVYLDACCLNRPFDDQTQDRIRIESEAIILILKNVKTGKVKLVGSDVLMYEIDRIADVDRRFKIQLLMKNIRRNIRLNENIRNRALELENIGFKGFDALHIASSESVGVNIFLSTDDKLLKMSGKYKDRLKIKVGNPILWITELFGL